MLLQSGSLEIACRAGIKKARQLKNHDPIRDQSDIWNTTTTSRAPVENKQTIRPHHPSSFPYGVCSVCVAQWTWAPCLSPEQVALLRQLEYGLDVGSACARLRVRLGPDVDCLQNRPDPYPFSVESLVEAAMHSFCQLPCPLLRFRFEVLWNSTPPEVCIVSIYPQVPERVEAYAEFR